MASIQCLGMIVGWTILLSRFTRLCALDNETLYRVSILITRVVLWKDDHVGLAVNTFS